MSQRPGIGEVVRHPVRLRIVQQLGGRELTTAQLREVMPDVTQPTLYRHVAALVDAEVVAVVAERRVRGAVERTLALGERAAHVDQAELHAMSQAQLRAAFLTFLGEVGARFDRFLAHDGDEWRDFLGFASGPLYVTTDDLATIQAGLAELLAPYRSDDGTGRRRVDLSTVLIPESPDRDPH